MDNVLTAEGDINSGSDPVGEVLMDPAPESGSDEEGGGARRSVVVAGVTPRTKKRGTSAIQGTLCKNTLRILKCGP